MNYMQTMINICLNPQRIPRYVNVVQDNQKKAQWGY